jgi:hypothetical protein
MAAQYFRKKARLVYGSGWILVAQDPSIVDTESLKAADENIDAQPIRPWDRRFQRPVSDSQAMRVAASGW